MKHRSWMWLSRVSLAIALVGGSAAAAGCGGPARSPHEAAGDLSAPDPEVRLKAARDLEDSARKNDGLPPDITEALLQRAPAENDFKTKASMLITLGYTGDPRVKPMLDQYAQTMDRQQRIYAARALKKYATKTRAVPPGAEFPEDWPYGTPGYPPPLPKAE